jgi:RNA polymerase sigma-70 factor (ECF subfamily)
MTEDRLTELYRRYGPVIYARCRALLQDEAAAEDATQETFIRVHRHLDRVPAEREALFWIYRVATNHCLNELRDRKQRPLLAEPPLDRPCPQGDPEGRLADRDLAARLIGAAPTKVRAIAWLYHVDGFEQEEVADILDVSRRTVINRLALFMENARKVLRRIAA